MLNFIYSSLTRISNLSTTEFEVRPIPKGSWRTGDYVVAEICSVPGPATMVELANGRQARVAVGDGVVGALGKRCATLEVVGDWCEIGDDLHLHAMTAAGIFGRITSMSRFGIQTLELIYLGHVIRRGNVVRMSDFARLPLAPPSTAPIVLILGSSMSSGKTLAATAIIRRLKSFGLQVGGAKFTGVGRYRDILAMQDAGADCVVDFVDAGLPSTCCSPHDYEGVVGHLLSQLAERNVEVIVAEAGASPLEPYNSESAIAHLSRQVCCTILCASDPYAALGVVTTLGLRPNLIAGRTASTSAGTELVTRLCSLPAMDLLEERNQSALDELLRTSLPGTSIAVSHSLIRQKLASKDRPAIPKEDTMPVQELRDFLDQKHVRYVTIRHSPAYTAQEIAASAHVPGKDLAKTVMVKIDGTLAMAVVPASFKVDLDALKEATNAATVELAAEKDFRDLFPGCEVGAMPPFGNLYDMDVFVMDELTRDEEIVFNAGSHVELIRLAYVDYDKVVKPIVINMTKVPA